jgi:hypothetical protein
MNRSPEKNSEQDVRPVQPRPEPERDRAGAVDYRRKALRTAQEDRPDQRTMNGRAFDLLHFSSPNVQAWPAR